MIEDNGDRKEDACIEGQLQKGKKRFRKAKGYQIHLKGGIAEMAQDGFGKGEDDDADENNDDNDMEYTFS